MMDYIDYVKNPNLAMNKLIKTLNVGATTTLLPERVRFNITDKNHKARVKQNTMQLSWWEKNGGKVKEYSWIAVGTVGAALVSVIPSPAPRMIALRKGMDAGKEAARKHQMNVEIAEEYFVALRNAIASIEFL